MPKPHLLLVHGALGSASQFESWIQPLEKNFQLWLPEFEGHGQTPQKENRPFKMQTFADNLFDFISKNNLVQPCIFGYSMGGYAALVLEQHKANTFSKIFTLATKFEWTIETATKEAGMLNPEKIKQKVPAFAELLSQRHSTMPWEELLFKTAEMMQDLGANPALNEENLNEIKIRVRLGLGDRDQMVSHLETDRVFRSLPNSELQMFPKTGHPLEKVDIQMISEAISHFFLN